MCQINRGEAKTARARPTDEQRMRARIIEATHVAMERTGKSVYWIDRQGRFRYANEAACHTLGYTRDELMALTVSDVEPAVTLGAWQEMWRRHAAHGPHVFESEHRRRDGGLIPVEISWDYVELGDDVFVCAFVRDITSRKHSEDALRESEERFRLLAENATDMISRHSPSGRFLYASPSARTLLGYAPEELLSMHALDLVHPDDAGAVTAAMRAFLDGAQSTSVTCRLRRAGGTYVWVESNDRAVRDAETGEIREFHSASRDISERKSAEQALRASEERFRLLAENSRDIISRHAADGSFTYLSPSCRQLGWEPEEIIGRLDELVHPDDIGHFATATAEVLRGDKVTFQYRIRRKDGAYAWIEAMSQGLRDPVTGAFSEFHASSRDITERKLAEEALKGVAQLKSEFVALVSHELRAPLTTLNSGIELLREDVGDLPPRTARTIEVVSAQTARLTRMVESILDVSRLDAGQLPLSLRPVALDMIAQEAMRSIAEVTPRVKLQFGCEGPLPLACADEVYVQQVVENLLRNAVKYAGCDQPIAIDVSRDGDRIALSVTDHGPGLNAVEQARLFEPFFRSREVDPSQDGHGLGLYFCRKVIEAQDGAIAVESPVPGLGRAHRGARFTFWLPCARTED